MSALKQSLTDAMKASMKSGDKKRLGVIRLMLAAIKQIEVDTREDLNDDQVLAVLDKMVKQRRDSATQYTEAGRDELAEQENYEITVLQEFLPEALSDEEIDALIKAAVTETGASAMQDMGKVMGILKPQVQGRADMGAVSGKIKAILTA
ncbi:MAG: GatB/YqeY domain-containing protein [Gammaproteobacteria bacterium]|nr:GatB/YqeY domain-containing protein [Gammaproteobacteria bacterium]